jgi:hypothetical protein
MQPGKQAEIRPLGHGEGQQGDGLIASTSNSSKLPTHVLLLEATNDKAAVPVLPATNHGKVKKSQTKRSSDVVEQNSVDGEFHLDYSEKCKRASIGGVSHCT